MTCAGASAPANSGPASSPPDGRAHRRSLLGELIAGALGTALLLWLLRKVLLPPVVHTFGHDFVFWYPIWQFYAEGLALGELRLWNPLSYGGVSLYPALLQLRVFDPISFLVIAIGHKVTPDLLALYNWDVFLRAWIPAVAGHVFLRRFAEHGITRIALLLVCFCSSFLLVLLRVQGAGQGFLWAPFIAIFFYRLVWLGDSRWRIVVGLAVFLGLNWQSYFFAPHLTFVVLVALGLVLFHPERLRLLFRTPHVGPKSSVAGIILAVMLMPLVAVVPEGTEVVYLPRVLDSSRPREDVGPIQYEPIPSPAVREVSVLMPPEFFISSGTPSTIWNFLQLVTPTGNWQREGGHGWGNPSEAFMYLGLPVFAAALWGLVAGRHPLRRVWMLILVVFGLLVLGPLGGAQSFLAWVFPLVRLNRHTHTYTPYFQLALLFFFVLGCDRVLRDLGALCADEEPTEPEAQPWVRRLGAALGIAFIAYLLLVETPTAFRVFSPGKAITPPALAVGFVVLWWLARRLTSTRLFWVLLLVYLAAVPLLTSAAVLIGLHTPPEGGLFTTLRWIGCYWALFLVLPLLVWWAARNGRSGGPRLGVRVAVAALFCLLVADQLFYVSYSAYLWNWPRPDRILGVSAQVTPLRFHETRGLYPPAVERSLTLGQAIRYPELLLRGPYLLTAPRGTTVPGGFETLGDRAADNVEKLRQVQRWNSFYVPRRYFALLHSETPTPVLARLWALGEPFLRFVPAYVVVRDAEFPGLFRDLGPSRGRCLLARAVVLPEEPRGAVPGGLATPGADAMTSDECPEVAAVALSVLDYEANRIVLEVTAPQQGFVVLSDSFHPRWVARVDGRPAPLLRADYLLKAVPVPQGRHTLEVEFEPGALFPALALFTALGTGTFVCTSILGLRELIRSLASSCYKRP
jgi:hypothetical protein